LKNFIKELEEQSVEEFVASERMVKKAPVKKRSSSKKTSKEVA
jgi:hypothetical protein